MSNSNESAQASESKTGAAKSTEPRSVKEPLAKSLARDLLDWLSSQQAQDELALKVEAALKANPAAPESILIGTTLQGTLSQSMAWSIAVRDASFEARVRELVRKAGEKAAICMGKTLIGEEASNAIFEAHERGESDPQSMGRDEFGLALNHWSAEDKLRFLIGQPDFTVAVSILAPGAQTQTAARGEAPAWDADDLEEAAALNVDPILAPWEQERVE